MGAPDTDINKLLNRRFVVPTDELPQEMRWRALDAIDNKRIHKVYNNKNRQASWFTKKEPHGKGNTGS